ncbi:tobH protein [Nocardia speluncae]|uniref:TobH protein n=1 Tax=Nocardia speluncae TaxID=419477 RepID=A0A846XH57_9NOCA|nr:tobH protein [Nocardia speluncae]NKY34040.1 tobH protein [Nocardia speluncae]
MIADTPVLDLDDAAMLEAADTGGALRSAASGGAQVRATAAAVGENALAGLAGLRPRSLLLVSGAGRAGRAAGLLVAALGDRAGLPLVPVNTVPSWAGPLDVVLVSGDDAGDPRLIDAVDRAVRRGAEVVVAAPNEGPLRAAAAGRAAVLEPRVPVLDANRLLRYLSTGIAVLRMIAPARSAGDLPDLTDLADVLDTEALRDGPQHEVFHNPAKNLAARTQQRGLILAGDSPATTELAIHAAEVLLQSAGRTATAVDLSVAVAALPQLVDATTAAAPDYDPLFHDEQLDGPPPVEKKRIFLCSADTDTPAARRKLALFGGAGGGTVDADLITADIETVPADPSRAESGEPAPEPPTHAGAELERLAVLALRWEMTAAYLRLIGGRAVSAGDPDRYDGGPY